MVEEAVKPVPETVTDVPTLPDVGLRVMAEVTVKVALAELAGEALSVAFTV